MISVRTDLALERHSRLQDLSPSLPGLDVTCRTEGDLEITDITVTSPEAAHALGKPEGTYITLDHKGRWQQEEDHILDIAHGLAKCLRPLLPHEGSILVVGLGNRMVTADALGFVDERRKLTDGKIMARCDRISADKRGKPSVKHTTLRADTADGIDTVEDDKALSRLGAILHSVG